MHEIVKVPSRQKSQYFDPSGFQSLHFRIATPHRGARVRFLLQMRTFGLQLDHIIRKTIIPPNTRVWDSRAAWLHGSTMSLKTSPLSITTLPSSPRASFWGWQQDGDHDSRWHPSRTTSRRMRKIVPFSSCFPASSRLPLKSQGPEQATCPLLNQSSQKG